MKKKIVIDVEADNEVIEKEKIKPTKKLINNPIIEWLIYMIGYALVLIIVSSIFSSFTINTNYFGIYALLAAIIINILNYTIKPFIKVLTFPITIISMGLLYPLSNVIILYITSLILGKENFCIKGFIAPFFIVTFISFFNILMEGFIIKPITKKRGTK